MTTPTYQIKRENIFIGQVVKSISNPNKLVLENGILSIYHFIPYRSILFTLNDQLLANDLLYDSPIYPALNLSKKVDCLDSEILIRNGYNLELLLAYFHFPENPTLQDIIQLRKYFFNGTWGYDNCHLFGFREIMPEDWTYVENGEYVKKEEDLKRLHQKERWLQKRGHRIFEKTEEALLPSDMMYKLSEFGDHSVLEVLQGFEKRRNAFKPHEDEGKIKKLSL